MTSEHPKLRGVYQPRERGRPFEEIKYDSSIETVQEGELSVLTMKILEHAQLHKLARSRDGTRLKESEIPQLMSWLGRDMLESSFALSPEEAIRIIRTGDMDNMYMRTRYVLESDPHFNRPLPEPSEQSIWEYIVSSPSYAKIFLDMQPDEIARVFAEAKDCLLYTSPSPRDKRQSRMPSSA